MINMAGHLAVFVRQSVCNEHGCRAEVVMRNITRHHATPFHTCHSYNNQLGIEVLWTTLPILVPVYVNLYLPLAPCLMPSHPPRRIT